MDMKECQAKIKTFDDLIRSYNIKISDCKDNLNRHENRLKKVREEKSKFLAVFLAVSHDEFIKGE